MRLVLDDAYENIKLGSYVKKAERVHNPWKPEYT